jgi:hypothetical protein
MRKGRKQGKAHPGTSEVVREELSLSLEITRTMPSTQQLSLDSSFNFYSFYNVYIQLFLFLE